MFWKCSNLKLNQTLYLGLILFPSLRLLWLHLKEPEKYQNVILHFVFTLFYIFSYLKLNQTLYLDIILFPLQRLWWQHLKEPRKYDYLLYSYSVLPIFSSEIESNPISRPHIVSSAKIMVTALKRAQKCSKNWFLLIFEWFLKNIYKIKNKFFCWFDLV